MIYTLTVNPTIDLVMNLKKPLIIGSVNRSDSETMSIGGKGINVATMLQHLSVPVTPIAVVAGFTGNEVENYLKETFPTFYVQRLQTGLTRFKINLKEEKETEVNGNGPIIQSDDFSRLLELLQVISKGDTLCISGSVPSSLDENSYAKILDNLQKKALNIVIDCGKNLLLNTLPFHPFLIKPNLEELGSYFNVSLTDSSQALPYLEKLQSMGARNILCSLGADGALLLTESGEYYHCPAPQGKLINGVGSGDSMIAGFIAEYSKSQDYKESLRMAVACGSATAFCIGFGQKEQVLELLRKMPPIQF